MEPSFSVPVKYSQFNLAISTTKLSLKHAELGRGEPVRLVKTYPGKKRYQKSPQRTSVVYAKYLRKNVEDIYHIEGIYYTRNIYIYEQPNVHI